MDKLAIFNMAISLAGGRRLASSIDAPMVETEQCHLWYDTARDSIFRRAYWPSIRLTNILVLIAENDFVDDWTEADPPLPWRFAYAAPAGMLAPRTIKSADSTAANAQFEIEDFQTGSGPIRAVLTDCPKAILTYTKVNENPTAWDNHLRLAVAHQLAAHIVPALSGNAQLSSTAQSRANFFVAQALETQSNTPEPVTPHYEVNAILDSRTGYYTPMPNFTSGRGQ